MKTILRAEIYTLVFMAGMVLRKGAAWLAGTSWTMDGRDLLTAIALTVLVCETDKMIGLHRKRKAASEGKSESGKPNK